MSLPTPTAIRTIALENGYEERRGEASNTLFFRDSREHPPTLVNVFYTTGGVMTKLSHPTSGYNHLWRSDAYDSAASLAAIFADPRIHTGKGYRSADHSARGCAKCGLQMRRGDFSKNQWRKGPGNAKCTGCVQRGQRDERSGAVVAGGVTSNNIHWESIIDSITCDAEGCNNSSPAVRCPSCLMVYYCSDACKRRHQRVHSQDCMDLGFLIERTRNEDPNLNSGLCNARASTLSQRRAYAMATQLSGRRTVEALLVQAESIHQADGDWERAIGLYKEILMKSYGKEHTEVATPPQWRQVWMGISRCSYELGDYDKAINAGTAAIEMNRHFPQVHKYVALSQKASGDRASALKTMKSAVLYEAPWSEETVQSNKDLLWELSKEH